MLQLMQIFLDRYGKGNEEDCLVLPTKEAARRCQAFLQQALEGARTTDNAWLERPEDETMAEEDPRSRIRIADMEEAKIFAVLFPAQTAAGIEAKAYWQHTGELVSSRRAELALKTLGQDFDTRITCCPIEGSPAILHPCESASSPETCYHQELKDRIAGWTNAVSYTHLTLPTKA